MTWSAILTISYRDFRKFIRDPLRIVATLAFPIIFVGVLGGSFERNLGDAVAFDFIVFTFTGIFGQTMFQSTATGIASLIADRETDFSQSIFIAPISRYAIVFGKILGESSVSLTQGGLLIPLGFVLGVPMSAAQVVSFIPAALVACLLGGAFGVAVLGGIGSQRSANQIFPFLIFPQFFLAGVFAPINDLPWYLTVLSLASPMRYAVDFTRGLYYQGTAEYDTVVLFPPTLNLVVMAGMFAGFLAIGTWLFVRAERNR